MESRLLAITEYNPFKFMIILLFVIAMLVLFIVMITYNILYGNTTYDIQIQKCTPDNTSPQCIPKPTPLPLDARYRF